jgi:ribosomal protein S11
MKLTAAVTALGLAVAGCGSSSSSSAPDVSGAPASDQTTLFRASNLSRVLNEVKAKVGLGYTGSVLKVEPRDVKLIAQGQTGLETVTVDNQGKSLVIKTPGGGAFAPFDLSLVSPAAAQTAVDTVLAKAHLGLSGISYLTFTSDPITHKPSWGVYLQRGGYYSADGSGGHVASHAPPSGAAAGAVGSGSGAQSTATCIQNAGSDINKIRKCIGQ